jgi:hypothetical protein
MAMMARRSPNLQHFLDLTRDAIAARTRAGDPAAQAAGKIFSALADAGRGEDGAAPPARLAANAHFGAAIDNANQGPADIAALAKAIAVIEPHLTWRTRAGASLAFAGRHANAMFVGPNGLEARDDVWIGMSLMAPDVVYPDHRHPPEEVYIVLSQGQWRQDQGAWHEPGIGGLVYNPSDIVHSMRSADAPLLAVWCLWAGDSARPSAA